jgi:hypothetical protein
MRTICAVVLAAALVTTSALAASNTDTPLAPGKPAGVQHAQDFSSSVMAIVGGVALVGMIAALASGGSGGGAGGANNPNGQLNTGVTSTTTST